MPFRLLTIYCLMPFLAMLLLNGERLSGKKQTLGPQKIASGSLASDEILYELLSRSRQLPRLLAVSTLADDPRYSNISSCVKEVPLRIGNSLEQMIGLGADIVFLSSYNRKELLTGIKNSKTPLIVLNKFNSIDDIRHNIKVIAKAIDLQQIAEELLNEFNTHLNELQRKNNLRKIGRIINWSSTGYLLGKNTTFDDIVTHLGGENIISTMGFAGWPHFSPEMIMSLQPDWIIASYQEPKHIEQVKKNIETNPAYLRMQAVKKGRLIFIPQAELHAVSPYILKAMDKIHYAVSTR